MITRGIIRMRTLAAFTFAVNAGLIIPAALGVE